MKHHVRASLLVLCAAVSVPAAEPSLTGARKLWLQGNYEDARERYQALTRDARQRPAATVGLSRTLESLGEYDKALSVVDEALKDNPKDADLLARRAEVLYLRGRWDEAEKAADAAVAAAKFPFLARWVRAQVYRDHGDLEKADAECKWFVRTYTQRSDADNDIKDPDELLLVGLAGAEHARWHNLSDQFEFILTEVYGDALKADKSFWPAEYQAGMLLLEKYNRPEALAAFDKALTINPSAAPALVGKGMAALQKFEFKDAEKNAERALNVNPKLPEALRLRADIHLAVGDAVAALKELERARQVNPRDERTLARVAACYHLLRKKDELEAVVKEVEKHDTKPALFHYELGEQLEERRHYDEAEKHFLRAMKLRPAMPGPANSLGLLYMRMGREKEAGELLEKGFAADKFNVRVSNMRRVLKHLQQYKTLQTDHFELRYDPRQDEQLARYMAGYLEAIYADLAGKFGYSPRGPILVEVFNNHTMFSGRVVSLPDLHTIGACTGKMVAMVSPHGKGVRKPFNWARVLRHELVHVFNLEQTNFLVPHWLTEGLAVSNEGFPRPQIWNELLLERVPAGKDVMDLDNIDLGFIRPRKQTDWHMAYCQAQLYVQHLKAQYGPDTPGRLLDAYREGLDTAAAIRRVCKVEKAAFEKGYRAFLEETVKGMRGKPAERPRSLKELEAEFAKDPKNADVASELALRLLERDRVKARELAEGVLEREKNHPKASYVLARLARLGGDVKQERRLLEAAIDRNAPDLRVVRALGKIYYDAKEFAKAAELFELGRKAEPFDNGWLQQLARVYAQDGEKDKQISVLKDLVPTDADDFDHRLRLARLLLESGQNAEAEKYAREALEIDLRNAEVRDILVKALRGQKKDAEAERVEKLLGK